MRHINIEDSETLTAFVKIVKDAAKDPHSSLYGVTSETGEQLIGDAHKGGGTTTDLDHKPQKDLAKVETIVEQHKKNEDVALKTPTGKMAALAELLTALSHAMDKDGFTVLADELDAHLTKMASSLEVTAMNPAAAPAGQMEAGKTSNKAPEMDFSQAPLAEDAAKMYEELEKEKKIAPATPTSSPVVPVHAPGQTPKMPMASALIERLIALANDMDDSGLTELAAQLDNEAQRVASFLEAAPGNTGALKFAEYGVPEAAADIQKMYPDARVTYPGQQPTVTMGPAKVTTSPQKHHQKIREMLGLSPNSNLQAELAARGVYPKSAQHPSGYSTWSELYSQIGNAKTDINKMLDVSNVTTGPMTVKR